jgi:sulfoxide reductase heme-binding subunit YedZ
MKRGAAPLSYVWWLLSDAAGIVALVLISLSVLVGLALAAKVIPSPKVRCAAVGLHEHLALTALAAIGVHGLALLGDGWLKPGWRGIAIPFALGYKPGFTGIGIIAGYLAVLLGPSFYVRRRIGARRWRRLHRFIVLVWILAVVHVLGAGSDAPKLWLRAIALTPVAPIVYLLIARTHGAARSIAPHRTTITPATAEPADASSAPPIAAPTPPRPPARRQPVRG